MRYRWLDTSVRFEFPALSPKAISPPPATSLNNDLHRRTAHDPCSQQALKGSFPTANPSSVAPQVTKGHSPLRGPSTAMSDLLSLSLFQLLSVISFLTSVIAVLRLGPGSLHRFSPKYQPEVSASSTEMGVGADKPASWSWSFTGLPVSFSLSTLIGDEEPGQDAEDDLEKLSGGSREVVRMHWQLARPRNYGQCPLPSLAHPSMPC